jgi:S1-C subfamily serine protease
MKAKFTVLTGARAGQTSIFSQAYICIGRHPQCELQFDPDKDLDVSSRHAAVSLDGMMYVLRDLGSTNGTFVNGRKLTTDHVLASNDVVRFGQAGPEVEFAAIGDTRPVIPPRAGASPSGTVVFGMQEQAEPEAPRPKPRPEQLKNPRPTPGPGTTTRVQIAVKKETKGLRRTTLILFGLLVVMSAAYLWEARTTGLRLAQQRRILLGQVDSLVQQIGALSAGNDGLRAALASATTEAERLKHQLTDASPGDAATMAELRRQLDAAIRRQRNLAGAARLNAAGIAAANRDAVAMVFVQFADGRVFTGTGFAVQSDPTGGLLITNKHVVTDSAGNLAERIGVVFNGTPQNFKADLVRVHADADLALLRASVHRGFPVVKKVASKDRAGAMGEPVAILGFPLGVDIAKGQDWAHVGAAATLTLGTVSRVLPDLLQLDSYGAQGSSGSPIFDREGSVIGVLYAGQPGSNGRIIYAVPARYVQELLAGQ